MKKIAIILLVLLLISCSYDMMYSQYTYVSINSASLFVVRGQVCTSYTNYLPIAIYNPNNYAITITAKMVDYTIAPFGTLTLEAEYE